MPQICIFAEHSDMQTPCGMPGSSRFKARYIYLYIYIYIYTYMYHNVYEYAFTDIYIYICIIYKHSSIGCHRVLRLQKCSSTPVILKVLAVSSCNQVR